MTKTRWILLAVAAVVVLSVGLYMTGAVQNYLDSRALAKYKKERDAYTALTNDLTQKLAAANARADAAEGRATALESKVPGLEAELAKFGEAGKKAVARQEEAAKTYEADTKKILTTTDGCVLCRDTCTQREQMSDLNDPARDFRCPAGFCDQYCIPH